MQTMEEVRLMRHLLERGGMFRDRAGQRADQLQPPGGGVGSGVWRPGGGGGRGAGHRSSRGTKLAALTSEIAAARLAQRCRQPQQPGRPGRMSRLWVMAIRFNSPNVLSVPRSRKRSSPRHTSMVSVLQ
jgi:hypothetical protein